MFIPKSRERGPIWVYHLALGTDNCCDFTCTYALEYALLELGGVEHSVKQRQAIVQLYCF